MLIKDSSLGFAQISNECLRNTELTLEDKGLLSVLLSLPKDFKLNHNVVQTLVGKTSVRALRKSISRLKEAGYIDIVPIKTTNKQFKYEWVVRDVSKYCQDIKGHFINSRTDKVGTDFELPTDEFRVSDNVVDRICFAIEKLTHDQISFLGTNKQLVAALGAYGVEVNTIVLGRVLREIKPVLEQKGIFIGFSRTRLKRMVSITLGHQINLSPVSVTKNTICHTQAEEENNTDTSPLNKGDSDTQQAHNQEDLDQNEQKNKVTDVTDPYEHTRQTYKYLYRLTNTNRVYEEGIYIDSSYIRDTQFLKAERCEGFNQMAVNEQNLLHDLSSIVNSVMNTKNQYVWVARELKSANEVKAAYSKLSEEHLLKILESLKRTGSRIKNIYGYLSKCLWNIAYLDDYLPIVDKPEEKKPLVAKEITDDENILIRNLKLIGGTLCRY